MSLKYVYIIVVIINSYNTIVVKSNNSNNNSFRSQIQMYYEYYEYMITLFIFGYSKFQI